VSLFAFVSGYGLYCSLRKEYVGDKPESPSQLLRWYMTRYIRSFSDYWLVVLLACIVCQAIDGHTYDLFLMSPCFAVWYTLSSIYLD